MSALVEISRVFDKHPKITFFILGIIFAHFGGPHYTLELAQDLFDFGQDRWEEFS